MAESTVQTATYQILITARETLQGVPGAAGATIVNDDFNRGPTNYNSSSAVPVTRASYKTYTMTGSAVTIDLTALDGTQDDIVGTGLKVQMFHIRNKSSANTINIAAGASNGYSLFGSGNDVDIEEGGELTMFFNDKLADISATVKNIALTGTNLDTCDVAIWLG